MSKLCRLLILSLCGLLPLGVGRVQAQTQTQTRGQVQGEAPASVVGTPVVLVAFASPEGFARLTRSGASTDFAPLANQFEPQSNGIFCGPTSATIVLNTVLRQRSDLLPRDASRFSTPELERLKQFGPRFDPTVPRFTQETVIAKGQKPRAVVLGEASIVGDRTVYDFGYQLRQLDQMLRANGADTRMVVVDDKMPDEVVRRDLVANLKRPDDYVIVNYRRELVGQRGGGHISPLGAYDEASDSFLVLDVNPSAAGWAWIPAATLISSMRSFDTVENRGYVEVRAR
jgi:hypothetical protein